MTEILLFNLKIGIIWMILFSLAMLRFFKKRRKIEDKVCLIFGIIIGIIMIVIQGYIIYIIFKSLSFIANTEILFNHVIESTGELTYNKKLIHLFYYFETLIKEQDLTAEDRRILRNILQQINLREIIDDTTTLENIKIYIDNLIDNYIQNITYKKKENQWYILFRNILGLTAVTSALHHFVDYYSALWTIISELQDLNKLYQIGHNISVSAAEKIGQTTAYGYHRFVLSFFDELRNEFPSILDIIFLYGLGDIPLQIRILLSSILIAILGTFLLPGFLHSFEKNTIPKLTSYLERPLCTKPAPIEELITFLDDMSTVSRIVPYNLYYSLSSISLLLVFITSFILFRKKYKRNAKENKNK
jgi:hypothetical protein